VNYDSILQTAVSIAHEAGVVVRDSFPRTVLDHIGFKGAVNPVTETDTAVEALKGDLRDKKKLMEALRNVKITCPRGPMKLDAYGSPIQNVYIRKVERVKGELQNTVIKTYENVSQFWKWTPEEYLKEPMYSRNFPPLGHYKKK